LQVVGVDGRAAEQAEALAELPLDLSSHRALTSRRASAGRSEECQSEECGDGERGAVEAQ